MAILYGIPKQSRHKNGGSIPATFRHVLCAGHYDQKLPGAKATDYVALVEEEKAEQCAVCGRNGNDSGNDITR